MPHFIVEYSANLDGKVDIKGLCDAILDAAIDADVFELGAIRVRALRCEAYAIADRLPENGFVDLSLRLAAGRAIEVKKKLGDAVFAAGHRHRGPSAGVELSEQRRRSDAASALFHQMGERLGIHAAGAPETQHHRRRGAAAQRFRL